MGLGNPPTQFGAFGHETDLRVRAAMVDEFLQVLTGLWSGHEVNFRGFYYTVRAVSMRPTPLQTPRVPIWVGVDPHHRGPRRRAARWDGFVPASEQWPTGVIAPDEYEAIVADIRGTRQRVGLRRGCHRRQPGNGTCRRVAADLCGRRSHLGPRASADHRARTRPNQTWAPRGTHT